MMEQDHEMKIEVKEENPEMKIEENPEMKIEENPEMKIEENPEMKIEENPEMKIEENPEMKIEENPEMKIEENPEMKIAVKQEDNELKAEVKQEDNELKAEVKQEDNEMKAEVKQEDNEESKVQEHQKEYQDLELHHQTLDTANGTKPGPFLGPSDLQLPSCNFFKSVVSGDNGVKPACTELPCQWKKGKKRKTPGPVSEKSSGKRPPSNVKCFDPRPKGSRVTDRAINTFLNELAVANVESGAVSMWETVLLHKYSDYQLPVCHRELLTAHKDIYLRNLSAHTPLGCHSAMIAGTSWAAERYLRMTASQSKEVHKLWQLIKDHTELPPSANQRLLNFIRKKVWGLDVVTTTSMENGLRYQDTARTCYLDFKRRNTANYSCVRTGLWVSSQFPELACSLDGLSFDPQGNAPGLVAIKVLKLLQSMSPKECVQAAESGSSSRLSRSCFQVKDGQLVLMRSHPYYYQIQHQLGVVGLQWCDFVLWSSKGEPSVERIQRDNGFIKMILESNVKFWKCVILPELIEMRAPRNLVPFVLRDLA